MVGDPFKQVERKCGGLRHYRGHCEGSRKTDQGPWSSPAQTSGTGELKEGKRMET